MSEITIAFLFKHFKFSPSKALVLKSAEMHSENKGRSVMSTMKIEISNLSGPAYPRRKIVEISAENAV